MNPYQQFHTSIFEFLRQFFQMARFDVFDKEFRCSIGYCLVHSVIIFNMFSSTYTIFCADNFSFLAVVVLSVWFSVFDNIYDQLQSHKYLTELQILDILEICFFNGHPEINWNCWIHPGDLLQEPMVCWCKFRDLLQIFSAKRFDCQNDRWCGRLQQHWELSHSNNQILHNGWNDYSNRVSYSRHKCWHNYRLDCINYDWRNSNHVWIPCGYVFWHIVLCNICQHSDGCINFKQLLQRVWRFVGK